LISPDDAYNLIKTLKNNLRIPIQLHTHYTSGMASMSCLKAIEAGVDLVDVALAPFALRSSLPAVEPFIAALRGTSRDPGLDLIKIIKLGQHLENIAPKYRDFLNNTKMAVIDNEVLMHQVPGGMITNLVSQLKEAGAIHKINEVLAELPKVRKELGYPPLVTPTSQIVGAQAVQNVLFGRYKMVSAQVKDYVYGLYGKPPAPVDPEVQKTVLKGYERGETPITCRPGDVLKPELENARTATRGLAKNIGDLLIYALYPTTGMSFLKWKYGREKPPTDTKAKTLEEIKKEDELIARAKSGLPIEKEKPIQGINIRNYKIYVGNEVYNIGVESVKLSQSTPEPDVPKVVQSAPAPSKPVEVAKPVEKEAASAPQLPKKGDSPVLAPMPGIIVEYQVQVGDKVNTDDPVLILEAMKMGNVISAPVSGVIKAINFKNGDRVPKDAILAIIGT
jgi:pyruvate carboxylase subunit B